MKKVLLLLILVSFSVCIKINVDPKKTWKSRTYKRDYKPFLKTIIDAKNTIPKKEFKKLKIYLNHMILEQLIQNANQFKK